jgi:predicted MFS family arabinose efflux permease
MAHLTAAQAPGAGPFPPALSRSVGVIMIGSALSFLDSTIVNVALRSLSVTLHAPLAQVQWVVTGYLLALAAVIPVTGWAARRFGPSRLYLAALATFTIGSALCALSRSAGMLLAPSGAGAPLANRLAAPMTDRLGAGPTALAGGLVSVAATVPFLFLGARTSYVLLCLVMVIRGADIGLSLVPAMTAAYRALPPGKIADATPQLNVLQRVGGSIGTAVFTVILTRQLAHAASPAAAAGAFGATFVWVLAIAAVATAPALLLARTERQARTGPPVTSPQAREDPDEVH